MYAGNSFEYGDVEGLPAVGYGWVTTDVTRVYAWIGSV